VISIISHSKTEGTHGFIVNKTYDDAGELRLLRDFDVSADAKKSLGNKRVGVGGPVDNVELHLLHNNPNDLTIGGVPLKQSNDPCCSDVVFAGGAVESAVGSAKDGSVDADALKIVSGCCVWEPGQLESELDAGFWTLCGAPVQHAVDDNTDIETGEDKLWEKLMSRMGFAKEANIPTFGEQKKVESDLVGDLLLERRTDEEDDIEWELSMPSNYID